jgi:hypothetical protein
MKPNGERMGSGDGDVRVVLEVIGDDQHVVTMYRSAPSVSDTRTDEVKPTTPATDKPDGQNRNMLPADFKALPPMSETVVYRAIYTRATGDEAMRLQRLIDNDRALTRASNDR